MDIHPAGLLSCNDDGKLWKPQRVLLFSGHMIDSPDRYPPRLPPEKAPIAAETIANTLQRLQAGCNDLALTQGASGGDILFAEACLQRGIRLQLLQPFTEPEFIKHSVMPAGAGWLKRYQAITAKLFAPPLAAPTELGPLPSTMNAYERCNLWLLASGLAHGAGNLVFICLWDGGGGDGPGGTAHMVAEVQKQHGQVIWLDTRKLG